jgi:periplasmic divalent cation tolerance protein
MIKTQADVFDALATRVHALHSYEVPEVIALPILAGAQNYLDWIQQETRGED